MSRVCKKCGLELDESLFPITGKGYLAYSCKACTLAYKQQWKEKNKDRVAEKCKAWRRANIVPKAPRVLQTKEEKQAYRKQWYDANKDGLRDFNKARHKEWTVKNRERRRDYYNNRYHNDPQYQLRIKLRTRVRRLLKSQGVKKSHSSCLQLLGCDLNAAINFLETKFYNHPLTGITMSWANGHQWEIDHIVPLYKFDLTDLKQQQQAFNYMNLQPLWKEDHKRKTYSDVFA